MKAVYFCLGDYRQGKKEYRIFKVRKFVDVHKITDYLGLPEITVENCPMHASDPNPEFALVKSALVAIEMYLRWVENVVCCTRDEHDEAKRMKQHFMNSDVLLYFPKLIAAEDGLGVTLRDEYPWILAYWRRRLAEGHGFGPMPFVMR